MSADVSEEMAVSTRIATLGLRLTMCVNITFDLHHGNDGKGVKYNNYLYVNAVSYLFQNNFLRERVGLKEEEQDCVIWKPDPVFVFPRGPRV